MSATTPLFAVLATVSLVLGQDDWTGVAATTRYWDCCKPSCSWPSNFPNDNQPAPGFTPVQNCNRDGSDGDFNAVNICAGGGDTSKPVSYMCNDNQPFTVDGVMYAFAAGGGAASKCCSCYELEFTGYCTAGCSYTGQLEGRRMVIQVTNTGSDLGEAHFDLQIPGGGFGIFNGCSATSGENPPNGLPQFMQPESNWGQRYGGVGSESACSDLPSELDAGCKWRFSDFLNSDNPAVKYREVKCPNVLTDISGCRLSNEVEREAGGAGGTSSPTPPPVPTHDPTPNPTVDPSTCSVEVFQQCDGDTYTGEKCCPAGSACYKEHQYYWQCRDDGCPAGWDCEGDNQTPAPPDPPQTTNGPTSPATLTPEPTNPPQSTPTYDPTTGNGGLGNPSGNQGEKDEGGNNLVTILAIVAGVVFVLILGVIYWFHRTGKETARTAKAVKDFHNAVPPPSADITTLNVHGETERKKETAI